MAEPTFSLPEIVAMLEASGAHAPVVDRFRKQAEFVLSKRAPLTQTADEFEVGSGYSHAKARGHVRLKAGEVEHQMEPAKAKQIALWLLEAAEAAVSDTIVMQFLREKVGLTDSQRAGMVLVDLREIRQGTRGVKYQP